MPKQTTRRSLPLLGAAALWLLVGCYDGAATDGPAEAAVSRYVEAMADLDEEYLKAHTCEGRNVERLLSLLDELGPEGRALFDSLEFKVDSDASDPTRPVRVAEYLGTKVTIVMNAEFEHCVESIE